MFGILIFVEEDTKSIKLHPYSSCILSYINHGLNFNNPSKHTVLHAFHQKKKNSFLSLVIYTKCNPERKKAKMFLLSIIIRYCFVLFVAESPDFSRTLLKRVTLVKVGGEVIIECKPKASPRPVYTWRKGREILRENERYCVEIFLIFD